MKSIIASSLSSFALSFQNSHYSGQAGLVTVNPSSKMLTDSEGRTLLLHGVNAIYKVPPYIPSNSKFDPEISLSADDISDLV